MKFCFQSNEVCQYDQYQIFPYVAASKKLFIMCELCTHHLNKNKMLKDLTHILKIVVLNPIPV